MPAKRPGFNERLYEFCVNYELVSSIGALIAGYVPGVPSPQDEADLGWDAEISIPSYGRTYLLQYKVARLTTSRAGANAKFWDVYEAEYYRFPLHRDARGAWTQHELLLEAAGPAVEPLYCAPQIHTRGALVDALRRGAVLESSELMPVASLGSAIGPGAHSVTYPVDASKGMPTLHSQPRRGARFGPNDFRRAEQTTSRPLNEATFEELAEAALAASRRRRRRRRRKERVIRSDDTRAAAYLRASAVAFDELAATLVVVPDPGD